MTTLMQRHKALTAKLEQLTLAQRHVNQQKQVQERTREWKNCYDKLKRAVERTTFLILDAKAHECVAEKRTQLRYNASDDFTFGTAMTASGCIPGIPLTSGQTVELRTFQNTGGNQTHAYRWGVRLHGAA